MSKTRLSSLFCSGLCEEDKEVEGRSAVAGVGRGSGRKDAGSTGGSGLAIASMSLPAEHGCSDAVTDDDDADTAAADDDDDDDDDDVIMSLEGAVSLGLEGLGSATVSSSLEGDDLSVSDCDCDCDCFCTLDPLGGLGGGGDCLNCILCFCSEGDIRPCAPSSILFVITPFCCFDVTASMGCATLSAACTAVADSLHVVAPETTSLQYCFPLFRLYLISHLPSADTLSLVSYSTTSESSSFSAA